MNAIKKMTGDSKKGEAWRTGYMQGCKETAKAYGGCTDCFGKGYATYRSGITQHADFYGDKTVKYPIKTEMRFCGCARGKQLKSLIKIK